MNKPVTPIVAAVAQVANPRPFLLNFEWLTHIQRSGNPDPAGAMILADLVYRYGINTIEDEATGSVIGYERRFSGGLLQRNYGFYKKHYGFSVMQSRWAIQNLCKLGIIIKVLDPVVHTTKSNGEPLTLSNVIYLIPNPKKLYEISIPADLRDRFQFSFSAQEILLHTTSDGRKVILKSGEVSILSPAGQSVPIDDDLPIDEELLVEEPPDPEPQEPEQPQSEKEQPSVVGSTPSVTNNRPLCYTQQTYTGNVLTGNIPNIYSDPPKNENSPQQQTFTMPGLGQTSCDWIKYGKGYETRQRVMQAEGMNVESQLLRKITDRLIDAHGTRHAIEVGADDRALTDAQQEAIALINMGLNTEEKIQELVDTFKADRGYEFVIGYRVLIQYASQAKASADQKKDDKSKKGSSNGKDNRNHVSNRQTKAQRELAERAKQYAHYDTLFDGSTPYVNPLEALPPLPDLSGNGGQG